MKNFGERFDTGDEPRAGPGKIATSFQGVDAGVASGGHRVPFVRKRHGLIFVARLFRGVAARGEQHNVRSGSDDVFKGYPERRGADAAKRVLAAGNLDHLRNPVPTDVKGLQPLEKYNAGTL